MVDTLGKMMKKIKIKLPPINLLKETPEQRKERVNSAGSSMITKIAHNKKKLTKKQQRQQNRKDISKVEY